MSRIRFPLSIVFPVFVILLASGGVAFGIGFPPKPAGAYEIEPVITTEYGLRSSPVMFIENAGQWKEDAKFQVLGGPGNAMWLAEDAIWITVMEPLQKSEQMRPEMRFDPTSDLRSSTSEPRSSVNIKLSFPGANPHPTIETFDRLDTKVSYFLGNDTDQWRPDMPVWGGVRYVDLWPGVDLEVGSQNGRLVQRFVAVEGTDVSAVQIWVEGADGVDVNGNRLYLVTENQSQILSLPRADFAYEVKTPTKHDQVDTLDIHPIAIDSMINTKSSSSPDDTPTDLLYGTFLGGGQGEYETEFTVDDNGCAYITGVTLSSNFPTTPGAFDTSFAGWYVDAYVAKLNPAGSGLIYATFLGGGESDDPNAIAVDGNGSAYVAGETYSSDFPTTPGAYDTSLDDYYGESDAFVVKLNPEGSGLTYATFLGVSYSENDSDSGKGIAVDGYGSAYVTGNTVSSDFPTTPGAFDTSFNGGDKETDAFVVKLNPTGSDLDYATFLGGGEADSGSAIAVDGNGSAHVTGNTWSSDFPTTPGAFDTNFNDHSEPFIVKLNPAGDGLTYATLGIGGKSIAVDGNGSAFVTGSTGEDFPATPGAFDTSFNGGYEETDAFVARLNPTGSGLDYATFLGGDDSDYGHSIAVDGTGNAYVAGDTWSDDFPTTLNAFDSSHDSYRAGFVVKLNPIGSGLLYSTFLEGSMNDSGHSIAVDENGSAYVSGDTESNDFPTTPGAYDTNRNSDDAFVVKLAMGAAIENLKINIVGSNVELSWSDVGGMVDHYEVWRSPTPHFMPGENGSEKIASEISSNPGGTVSYTDISHHLTETETNDYYVVRAVDESEKAFAPSEYVAAFTVDLMPGK